MKTYTLLILPCLFLVACATSIEHKPKPSADLKKEPTSQLTSAPARDEDIAFPEQIKAYQIGRYVDPADFNTLHERHTIYRREQSGYWNLAAAKGVGASRSYYLTADKTQQNQQQQAYYEAAQEQARVAKEQLTSAEQKVAALEKENSALKEKVHLSRIYEPIQQHQ